MLVRKSTKPTVKLEIKHPYLYLQVSSCQLIDPSVTKVGLLESSLGEDGGLVMTRRREESFHTYSTHIFIKHYLHFNFRGNPVWLIISISTLI